MDLIRGPQLLFWLLLILRWIQALSTLCYEGIYKDAATNGFTMLKCSGQQLDVIYELKGMEDSSSHGIIRLLNVVCVGNNTEEIEVVKNGISRPLNRVQNVNNVTRVSSPVDSCTVFGCYEDETELVAYVLPNSTCSFSLPEQDYAMLPIATLGNDYSGDSEELPSTTLLPTTTAMRIPMKEDYQTLLTVVSVIGAMMVLSVGFLLALIWSLYRIFRAKTSRPVNLHYSLEVVEKFDPNFNPIKIGGQISASPSTESVVHGTLYYYETELEPTDTEYINTNNLIMSDSNSTSSNVDSYFVCSDSVNDISSQSEHDMA